MLNYLTYFIILVIILITISLFASIKPPKEHEKEIIVDLNLAHHVINQIGLNSSDDLLTSQIKQLFIKNKNVSPDIIEHLAEHYHIPTSQLYLKIHQIINQPLTC